MGTIPDRETSPTVGLRPTRPQHEAGETIDPSVSVPMPTAARFAEMAAPVPELEQQLLAADTLRRIALGRGDP